MSHIESSAPLTEIEMPLLAGQVIHVTVAGQPLVVLGAPDADGFLRSLTRQPYVRGRPHRVCGMLENTEPVMACTFWIVVNPGLTTAKLDFLGGKAHRILGC